MLDALLEEHETIVSHGQCGVADLPRLFLAMAWGEIFFRSYEVALTNERILFARTRWMRPWAMRGSMAIPVADAIVRDIGNRWGIHTLKVRSSTDQRKNFTLHFFESGFLRSRIADDLSALGREG